MNQHRRDPVAIERPPLPRRLLHPRHWPAWLLIGAMSLVLLVPRPLRDRLAGAVGELRYRTNTRRRGIVELNLAKCYPELDEEARRARARAHFRAYACVMADQASLWWDWRRRIPERRCRVHGLEHANALHSAGERLILLNAHTIAIDFGGVALARHLPLVAIVRPVRNPVFDWFVTRVRVRFGGELYAREAGMRPVIRAVRRGRCLYYSPDEDLGPRDSVLAPFFGQPKATLATLGRLAQLLDAHVVPVYTWYDAEHGCYQVHVRPPLADFPSGDPETDAMLMNQALEQSISLCPAQYLWNFRLFRTGPDGSKLAYPPRSKSRWRELRRRLWRQKPRP